MFPVSLMASEDPMLWCFMDDGKNLLFGLAKGKVPQRCLFSVEDQVPRASFTCDILLEAIKTNV